MIYEAPPPRRRQIGCKAQAISEARARAVKTALLFAVLAAATLFWAQAVIGRGFGG